MMSIGPNAITPLVRATSALAESMDEAKAFFAQYAEETGRCPHDRIRQVMETLGHTGTYEMTADELVYAAKLGWRNSTRCIGRLFWQGLIVRDMRHLATED